jgi:hypothetical protein
MNFRESLLLQKVVPDKALRQDAEIAYVFCAGSFLVDDKSWLNLF